MGALQGCLSRGSRDMANGTVVVADSNGGGGGGAFAMDYGIAPQQTSSADRNTSKAISSIAVLFMDSVTQRNQNRISPLDSSSKISIVNPVGSTGGNADSSNTGDGGASIWTWN